MVVVRGLMKIWIPGSLYVSLSLPFSLSLSLSLSLFLPLSLSHSPCLSLSLTRVEATREARTAWRSCPRIFPVNTSFLSTHLSSQGNRFSRSAHRVGTYILQLKSQIAGVILPPIALQGYFAHTKTPTPLGTPWGLRPWPTVGS